MKIPSLIKKGKIEEREYQKNIYKEIKDENSLVILPTGLGKTIIAALLIANKLEKGSILFTAPTKPLCEQHAELLNDVINIASSKIKLITGETHNPSDRENKWNESDFFIGVATPQTILNDLDESRLNLEDFSLAVFDEVHRTVGNYAYGSIADKYFDQSRNPQILGLTASPGNDFDKLKNIAKKLRIESVSVRSKLSDDVKPYVGDIDFEWIKIDKPDEMNIIEDTICDLLDEYLSELAKYTKQAKNLSSKNLSKKALIEIQQRFRGRLSGGNAAGYIYHAISIVATCIKLAHMKDLLSTQGPEPFISYIEQLQEEDSKASKRICNRQEFKGIKKAASSVKNKKLEKVKEILRDLNEDRVIVFAEYRDTVETLIKELDKIDGVKPRKFIGQAQKKDTKGMSQEEQKERLSNFKNGEFNVLVSTSIGEEGIDIPSTSLVLFYEPVPSSIRLIQRKGRTARDGKFGKVIILIMKNSRDEAYYWKSIKGQKKMYRLAYKLKNIIEESEEYRKGKLVKSNKKQTKMSEYYNSK